MVLDVSPLKGIVNKLFPGLWPYTEACLAAIATLYIGDVKDPASMILIGPPSSNKTTVLEFLTGHPETYTSNKFTPASFVSCESNRTEEELRNIDFLPKIKDKTLIVPDLAPTFADRPDTLRENVGVLTAVMDGYGYTRDTGTHGRRGYEGEYRFTFLGATTPLTQGQWPVLGKLGNRLTFLEVHSAKKTADEAARSMREDISYKEKCASVRAEAHKFLTVLSSVKPVLWNRVNDPQDIVGKIYLFAGLSGGLRGVIPTARTHEGSYERAFTVIEEPNRFFSLLYNLGRGRALVNGRNNIDASDLELVRDAAISSCYEGRSKVLHQIIDHGGTASTDDIITVKGCSRAHAIEQMEDLEVLGLVDTNSVSLQGGGRVKTATLKPEYYRLFI